MTGTPGSETGSTGSTTIPHFPVPLVGMKRITFVFPLGFLAMTWIVGLAHRNTLENTSLTTPSVTATAAQHIPGAVLGPSRATGLPNASSCLVAPQQRVLLQLPTDYRPSGGIIDGQGCCSDDACLEVCHRCECSDPGNAGNYLWFTDFSIGMCMPWLGGNIYYENRGYDGRLYLPLLAALFSGLLLCVGVLLGLSRRCPLWVHRRVFSPYNGTHSGMRWLMGGLGLTRGECLAAAWLLAVLLLGFCYVFEHARINNLVGKLSRGFGGVCVFCGALVVFPATRHSVLLACFGASFERTLKFHRFLGACFYLCSTAHMVLMFVAYADVYHRGDPWVAQDGSRGFINQLSWAQALQKAFSRTFLAWNVGFPHGPPLAGFVAWLAMSAMVLGACTRRARWEAFLLTHMGYAVVFVFGMIHYPTLLLLTIPAFAAYAVDLALRHRGFGPGLIQEAVHFQAAGVTRLQIKPRRALSLLKGGFVTIAIPGLDGGHPSAMLEHHPFSVSSHSQDGSFTLHVKDFGAGAWTHRLARAAERLAGLPVQLDGPFGEPGVGVGSHKVSYLVAGGVGITPMIHLFQCALETGCDNAVVLLWSVRTAAMLEPFRELLVQLCAGCARCPGMSVRLFESSKTRPAIADGLRDPEPSALAASAAQSEAEDHPLLCPGDEEGAEAHEPLTQLRNTEGLANDALLLELPEIEAGRPEFGTILRPPDDGDASDVAVYVCGPEPLVHSIQHLCYAQEFLCHTEIFKF